MSLDRFKQAQARRHGGFETALRELHAGRKSSHWIWYIFPQLAGLGRSTTAEVYAIADLEEACAYLRDPILRDRMIAATEAVVRHLPQGARLLELMNGNVDSLKLVSSLTLFEAAATRLLEKEASPALTAFVAHCHEILAIAKQQGFDRCAFTLEQIKVPRE